MEREGAQKINARETTSLRVMRTRGTKIISTTARRHRATRIEKGFAKWIKRFACHRRRLRYVLYLKFTFSSLSPSASLSVFIAETGKSYVTSGREREKSNALFTVKARFFTRLFHFILFNFQTRARTRKWKKG